MRDSWRYDSIKAFMNMVESDDGKDNMNSVHRSWIGGTIKYL